MANTLRIIKKTPVSWWHEPSNFPPYANGGFITDITDDLLQNKERNGSNKAGKFLYSDVTVIDETTGETYEPFSAINLANILTALSYPGFKVGNRVIIGDYVATLGPYADNAIQVVLEDGVYKIYVQPGGGSTSVYKNGLIYVSHTFAIPEYVSGVIISQIAIGTGQFLNTLNPDLWTQTASSITIEPDVEFFGGETIALTGIKTI